MATLVGIDDETSYTTNAVWNNGTVYGGANGYTAVSTGTADTAHIYVRYAQTGGGIKILVYDSSRNLIATSSVITKNNDSGVWLTASISASITSGNTYYICAVSEAGAMWMYSDGSATAVPVDASGSYASPPDPLTTSTGSIGLFGPLYLSSTVVPGTTGGSPLNGPFAGPIG